MSVAVGSGVWVAVLTSVTVETADTKSMGRSVAVDMRVGWAVSVRVSGASIPSGPSPLSPMLTKITPSITKTNRDDGHDCTAANEHGRTRAYLWSSSQLPFFSPGR